MTAAAALLFFAGALTFLCLVPLDLSLQAERSDTFSSDIRATWLFGLVEKRFRIAGKPPSSKLPGKAPKAGASRKGTPPRARKGGGKGRGRALLAAIRSPGFPARLARFAVRLLRTALPRHVSLRLEGGFEDPAATGIAVAVAASVSPALNRIPRLEFTWEPDFEEHELKGRGAAHFRFVPGRLLWTCARFACHPVTVRALLSAHRRNRQ